MGAEPQRPQVDLHNAALGSTVECRAAKSRVSATVEAAKAVRTRRDDVLTISVLPSFASRWLMPRLIRFMDANPGIEVNVNASTALANFVDDEVDVAIRFGVGPWPPLVCEQFLEDEYFPVASPRWNRGRLPKTPRDLLGLRMIREDRDYWTLWFKAAGVTIDSPIEGPLFNDSTYSLQAAARGEGIALGRRSIVAEDLERGTLKRLFDIAIPSRQSYWFVSPRETADTPKVRAFRDWVRRELGS